MKVSSFFFVALIAIASCGQKLETFEGKVVYENSIKSKTPNVTDQQFLTMYGSKQEYYLKDGDYKSITNSSIIQWQLYINKDNKLYTKMTSSDTVIWNDGGSNPDTVYKVELNPGVTEILGNKCDELVLNCKSGTWKFYYSTKYFIEPSLFVNHKFGNWYEYISKAKSLVLKSVIENDQFIFENVATEIKRMKLEKSFFELAKDVKTMKSPF